MKKEYLALGGGGIVVGILLAVAISSARMDTKVDAAVERAQAASAEALQEASAAMEARIAELEAGMSETADSASTALEDRLAALQDDVASQIEAVAAASETAARDLESALTALVAAATPAADTSATDALAGMPSSGPHGVGETAIFLDGKLRAFVVGLDLDGGTARLSVNGETMAVALGETASVAVDGSDCGVGVAALDGDGATIAASCDMGDATAAAAEAPENGVAPGAVALLADGGLRVFVSGLAADGSSARIAINGVEMQTVDAGASVDVTVGDQSCTVTVTGVGGGLVGLDGSCG